MKEINVYVNPYLEYMNGILLTSRYNEITKSYIGYGLMTTEVNEYTTRIIQFFDKCRNDAIYQYIENLIPNGFTFSRPVELMLSLGRNTDFSMQYTPSEICLEYCGGISKMKELLSLLKEYEEQIKFFRFFEEIKNDNSKINIMQKPNINLSFNLEYGVEDLEQAKILEAEEKTL